MIQKKGLHCSAHAIDYCPILECERSSVVEPHLAKVVVEGSNPFARSIFFVEV